MRKHGAQTEDGRPEQLVDADCAEAAALEQIAGRFVPAPIGAEIRNLDDREQAVLVSLIRSADGLNELYREQLWCGNRALAARLTADRSRMGQARLRLFRLFQGPWADLENSVAFVPGVPDAKPPGANLYPENLSHAEWDAWMSAASHAEAAEARSFVTRIHRDRDTGRLQSRPYGSEYREWLAPAAAHLKQAAATTRHASLKRFLELRADAFLSNDYYASEVAWMELNAPIELTIGPYETYIDEFLGYKAAFEAYVGVKDEEESRGLARFAQHLQFVEDHLPIAADLRNPRLGNMTPISVVNELFAAGDACDGIPAAAFNLPNDERVILEKGSKKVMLKNVQQAKFHAVLVPVAGRVLDREAQDEVNFHWFFLHILAHELCHGIGPQEGVRHSLRELYSPLEEAKADACALFMLQLLFTTGRLTGTEADERALYRTYLASGFRTLRFGLREAHGHGMALQFSYLLRRGALRCADGRFDVSIPEMRAAVRDLVGDLLTIEGRGDYQRARAMLAEGLTVDSELSTTLARLDGLPVDIAPVFHTALEIAGLNQP